MKMYHLAVVALEQLRVGFLTLLERVGATFVVQHLFTAHWADVEPLLSTFGCN